MSGAATGPSGGDDECPATDPSGPCRMTPEVMRSFYDACNPWSDYTIWGAVPVVGQQRQANIIRQSPLTKVTLALQEALACLDAESSQLDGLLATQEIAIRATLNNLTDSLRSIIDVAVESGFQPLRYTQYMLGMYAGALGILLALVVLTYD